MKQENDRALFDAITGIDDDLIAETADTPVQNRRKPYWFAAVAALLVLAIGIGAVLGGNHIPGVTTGSVQLGSNPMPPSSALVPTVSTAPLGPIIPSSPSILEIANLAASPIYPKMVAYPEDGAGYEAFEAWRDSRAQQYDQPEGYADNLHDFFIRSTQIFLSDHGAENAVCSPLNIYMLLATLAECTDGQSRQQILDLLDADNIVKLREQAGHVWNAHYCADGRTTSVLANSLWLDYDYDYDPETVQILSDNYFASVYHGDMGSDAMNVALQAWLNEQTGGLLTERVQGETLDAGTIFALYSTILYQAGWDDIFMERATREGVFHGAKGNQYAQFMWEFYMDQIYYRGENFGAMKLGLSGSSMMLILPDEGYSPQDLLSDGACLELALNPGTWEDQKDAAIDLLLPKFDISSNMDLIDGLKELGVTDIFDPLDCDCSSLLSDSDYDAWVNEINHTVRVAIDENGVFGVSYTDGQYGSPIPIHMTFDRPFLFVITSQDGLPLFTGIVNEP